MGVDLDEVELIARAELAQDFRRDGSGAPGLSVMGQLDGGGVLGRVHQEYDQAIANVGSGTAYATANEPAPFLELRFGVEYAPHFLPNMHLSSGYLFNRWWTVGETNGTQGDVTYQGVFLRGEYRY
jgi:hypothetical protein